MQLGSHFGKRKPRWNFFTQQAIKFRESQDSAMLKKVFVGTVLQFILLSPLIYWTLQNFSFFEAYVPLHTHLKEHIVNERHWILFLYAICFVGSFVWNFALVKYLVSQKAETLFKVSADIDDSLNESPQQTAGATVTAVSPDVAGYRRRAS